MTALLQSALLLALACSALAALPATEIKALQDLFTTAGGATWTVGKPNTAAAWDIAAFPDPCIWPGVVCDSTKANVIGINLPNNNLFGVGLPTTLKDLGKLQKLYLQSNTIRGSIPEEVFLNKPYLTHVYLDHNKITNIPASLFALPSVQVITWDHNSVSQANGFPAGLTTFPSTAITTMTLGYQQGGALNFGGTLPSRWDTLKNLAKLDITGHRLSGTLPATLINHVNLKVLELQGGYRQEDPVSASKTQTGYPVTSGLTGTIPEQISPNLFSGINLAYNRFTCTTPQFAQTITYSLNLTGNFFMPPVTIQGANTGYANIASLSPTEVNLVETATSTLQPQTVELTINLGNLWSSSATATTPFQTPVIFNTLWNPTSICPNIYCSVGEDIQKSYVAKFVNATTIKCTVQFASPGYVPVALRVVPSEFFDTADRQLVSWLSKNYLRVTVRRKCPEACGSSTTGPFVPFATTKGVCSAVFGLVCNRGWAGSCCNYYECPRSCSGQGTCAPVNITGVCTCNTNYLGTDCSIPKKACASCPAPIDTNKVYNCNEQTGKCLCKPAWTGADCKTPVCLRNCTGHGSCKESTTTAGTVECKCSAGWTGADCSYVNIACTETCTANAFCDTATGTCKCSGSFTNAPACDRLACARNSAGLECSGRGSCVDTRCVCNTATDGSSLWSGPACETTAIACKYKGNVTTCGSPAAGYCDLNTGECVCARSFAGAGCTQRVCEPACDAKGGVCSNAEGKCVCKDGFFGPTCARKSCGAGTPGYAPSECGTGGVPKGVCNYATGTCLCTDPNFYGPTCSSKVCPGPKSADGTVLYCNGDKQGTCDGNTGTCTCTSDYTLGDNKDCSQLKPDLAPIIGGVVGGVVLVVILALVAFLVMRHLAIKKIQAKAGK